MEREDFSPPPWRDAQCARLSPPKPNAVLGEHALGTAGLHDLLGELAREVVHAPLALGADVKAVALAFVASSDP